MAKILFFLGVYSGLRITVHNSLQMVATTYQVQSNHWDFERSILSRGIATDGEWFAWAYFPMIFNIIHYEFYTVVFLSVNAEKLGYCKKCY